MGVGKPIIGVLEKGSEVRMLIDEIGCGKCCEPGEYDEIADIIRWYIQNANTDEVKQMGLRGRKYLEDHLTKDVSVGKYIDSIFGL